MISTRAAVWLMALIAAVVAAIAVLFPPIPQPYWYHMFADQRRFLGIPHFNNVISNVPFAAVGLWGSCSCYAPMAGRIEDISSTRESVGRT